MALGSIRSACDRSDSDRVAHLILGPGSSHRLTGSYNALQGPRGSRQSISTLHAFVPLSPQTPHRARPAIADYLPLSHGHPPDIGQKRNRPQRKRPPHPTRPRALTMKRHRQANQCRRQAHQPIRKRNIGQPQHRKSEPNEPKNVRPVRARLLLFFHPWQC